MLPIETIITQINSHHQNAMAQANSAIDSAKAAGELLLKAKAALPHGTFTKWLHDHLNVSERQAQRYMAAAQGKAVPLLGLAGKTDTVSDLKKSKRSTGVWKNEKWRPEAGCFYLFREGDATYWVHPSTKAGLWLHVCKHYSGARMSTDGFIREWNIFGKVTDQDLTSQFYVGTTRPLGYIGVEGVLKSYGLTNLRESLSCGIKTDDGFERPFGEPSSNNWYWGNNGEWDDREAHVDSLLKANEA
jgi:hypothetical protein